jgi:hypothetical protein
MRWVIQHSLAQQNKNRRERNRMENIMATYNPGMLTATAPIPIRKPWPYVNVKEFGPDATGKTEAQARINAAIASLPPGGGDCIIPRGMYLIESVDVGVRMKSNMRLVLEDGAVLQCKTNDYRGYGVLRANGIMDAVIQFGMGAMVIGDKETHIYSEQGNEALNTHEWGHCIQVLGSQRISVFDAMAFNGTGDGMVIGAKNIDDDRDDEMCNDIFVRGASLSKNRRQGISIGRGTHIVVQKSEIFDIGGTGPGAGIDVEPANPRSGTWVTDDIIIEDCYIHNNQSADILLFHGAASIVPITNVMIRRNRLENSNLGIQAVGADGYWIIGNRITHHNASGTVLGKLSKNSHFHENTSGFNYLRQGERDRVDFEFTGYKTGLAKDILIANGEGPNDIGKNYYI